MFQIPFRKYNFNITQQNGTTYIFDEIRKKNVVLGPEEWVRQNILHYLIYDLGYPKSRIAIEKEFTINNRKKRFDILVFTKDLQPFLLVECKAPEIHVSDATVQQVIQYNLHYKSQYLLVSNGNVSYCFGFQEQAIKQLNEVPSY